MAGPSETAVALLFNFSAFVEGDYDNDKWQTDNTSSHQVPANFSVPKCINSWRSCKCLYTDNSNIINFSY